jgi:DNA repair exonuclease SbcCD ATPase subunit
VFTVPWSLGLFGENICEKCKCVKSQHVVADKCHYVSETKKVPLDNSAKIDEYNNKKDMAIQKSVDQTQQTNNLYYTSKDNLAALENRKKELEQEKDNNEKNKIEIEKKMEEIKKKILLIVLDIQKTSNVLERNSFNKANIKNENDYIDELSNHLSEIGDSQAEQRQKLNEIKILNKQFMKYAKINIRDLENMSMDELVRQVDEFFENNQ